MVGAEYSKMEITSFIGVYWMLNVRNTSLLFDDQAKRKTSSHRLVSINEGAA